MVPKPDLAAYSKTIEEVTREIIGKLNRGQWPKLTTRIVEEYLLP